MSSQYWIKIIGNYHRLFVLLFTEPSGPPTSVRISEVTSSTVSLTWNEPICGQRRGQIIAYSYFLMNISGMPISSGNTTDKDVLIKNLTPFTNYNFTVLAITMRGVGPTSAPLNLSTEDGGLNFCWLCPCVVVFELLLFFFQFMLWKAASNSWQYHNKHISAWYLCV